MEFEDHIDYIGRKIEGSEQYRAILTPDEVRIAQQAIRAVIVSDLQIGARTHSEAELAYDLILYTNGIGCRLVTPEKSRIFAQMLEVGAFNLTEDEGSETARQMALQLRSEADVREIIAGNGEITPDMFNEL